MKELLNRIKRRPGVAHLLRANQRFNGRLGNQFGAAITYFSVLALVPILMFAFSVAGFILVEVLPEWRQTITDAILGKLGDAPDQLKDQVTGVINTYLSNYATIGVIGLLSAMYAGAGWMGNLKSAVRAQWRPDFDLTEDKRNIVIEILINFAILLGLLVLVAVTLAVANVATSLSGVIIDGLGMRSIPGIGVLVRIVPIVVSLAVGWVLFMFLFLVLPQDRVPMRARVHGSLIASVGLGLLEYLTGFLFGLFASNAAAAVFGPVIVLMLFFNLFARLTLFCAAWIATSNQPALSARESGAEQVSGLPQGPATPTRLRAGDVAAAVTAATPVDGHVAWVPGSGQPSVPQQVAVRSVRIGMGAGYLTGAASGIGLGAVTAVVANRLTARRSRRRTKRTG